MERLIFHIDVNSAFLSWEAARIVRDGGEDIRLIPSVIGGDPNKRTGVVLAKSIPAKKYGIKTGEPLSAALRKCPNLFIARPDFSLYERNSRAFMDICRQYTPTLEKFSIDECFLDMSGMHLIYPDPIATAHEIKDRIYRELGFTVNVGIGPNKLLAKMASDFEKPNKVHTLMSDEVEAKMWKLPVRELFSVGASTAARLERSHIYTVGDLARRSVKAVQAIVGVKFGELIHAYANGVDNSPVSSQTEEAKGYSISTTFEEDITSMTDAKAILLMLSDSVSARMRADGAQAYCIGVTVRTGEFKNSSHQRKLFEATDITSDIYNVSSELIGELWDGHTPIRLIGISLTSLTRGESEQISFFEDEDKEKKRKIDKTVDNIRNKFGSETVVRGTSYKTKMNVGKKYKAQMENKEDGEDE
ncbi:MAG: DNA polymerase IV [Clostridia bacterium]|nr:DNA polymerase IV [Clostridia bacterium]